ncbi:MAG: triose-phosphate isomerase [Actinobacteria bacterium]|nr:triose-phosphate isomerase [Actinomycetota bacterium]
MRKPVIAGNWKMNMTPEEGVVLVEGIWDLVSGQEQAEVVVCPPFVDIPAVSESIRTKSMEIGLGAQNMYWEETGAFTGEVSPSMLLKLNVTHVIIGHSERRQFFGESDQGVNRKVKSAIDHGIVPIMCVGESLKQREAGEMQDVVTSQVKCGLFELEERETDSIIIAYEPIWAIGTGVAATVTDAEEAISLVRKTVGDVLGTDAAEIIRILYGGSVKPENISEFISTDNVDGALVGGASLKPESFAGIVRFS